MLIAAGALAAEPVRTEAEVAARTEAIARYGKEIPWAAMCFSSAAVDGVDVLVVGVSQAATGCGTYGTMVGGAWTEPDVLPGWAELDAAGRERRARAWVDQVLLAFAQPFGEAVVRSDRAGVTVVREALRRDGQDRRAAEVVRTVVVGADGHATSTEEVRRTWTTTFALQALTTDGLGGADGIRQSLGQVGGDLQRCVDAAWRADHALQGHARLTWAVAEGATSAVAVIEAAPGEADMLTLPDPLIHCWGEAVRLVRWGDGASGSATWTFLVGRR